MAGPISKSELGALSSLVRDPKQSGSLDDSTRSSLASRGLIKEKLGRTEVTNRGKMTIQRRESLSRGKRR